MPSTSLPAHRRVVALVVVPGLVVAVAMATLYLVVMPLVPAVHRYYFAQSVATYATYRFAIYGHIVCSTTALALGPLVLWRALRRTPARRPAHRRLGAAYAVAVAGGGTFGGFMAFHAYAGTLPGGQVVVTSGMLTLAAVWLATLAAGIRAMAVHRDLARHRYWMTVNVSATYAGVTYRLAVGALVGTGTFEPLYAVFGWLGWAPTVAGGVLLARRALRRSTPRAAATVAVGRWRWS